MKCIVHVYLYNANAIGTNAVSLMNLSVVCMRKYI
jgi:hypothetical protein